MELIISISINVVLFIIVLYQLGLKKASTMIHQLMIEAEKAIPGQTTEQKIAWVKEQIGEGSFLNRFFSFKILSKIIETAIDIIDDKDENN